MEVSSYGSSSDQHSPCTASFTRVVRREPQFRGTPRRRGPGAARRRRHRRLPVAVYFREAAGGSKSLLSRTGGSARARARGRRQLCPRTRGPRCCWRLPTPPWRSSKRSRVSRSCSTTRRSRCMSCRASTPHAPCMSCGASTRQAPCSKRLCAWTLLSRTSAGAWPRFRAAVEDGRAHGGCTRRFRAWRGAPSSPQGRRARPPG